MVDTRGAVDLRATAPTLWFDEPSGDAFRELGRVSDLSFDIGDVYSFVTAQTLRLAVAMVLHARLMNVATERLTRYGLVKDPNRVTLAELAGLHRPHRGVAGQAFEIAVAEACNHGVPEVVGPISWALRQIGVDVAEPPRMLVLGLEKFTGRPEIWDELREALPEELRLRNGLRGRPAHVATVLDRLANADWDSMKLDPHVQANDDFYTVLYGRQRARDSHRHGPSQLARCDALVFTGSSIVPASLKINSRHVDMSGWRDVPLWITTSGLRNSSAMTAEARDANWPTVVACLNNRSGFGAALGSAVVIVDSVLGRIDPASRVPRPLNRPMAYNEMQRALYLRRSRTIAEIEADLRSSVAPDARAILEPRMSFDATNGVIPTLANPDLVRDWKARLSQGQVNYGHRHLWVHDYAGDLAERAQLANPDLHHGGPPDRARTAVRVPPSAKRNSTR